MASAIALHNFPEGMTIGASFANNQNHFSGKRKSRTVRPGFPASVKKCREMYATGERPSGGRFLRIQIQGRTADPDIRELRQTFQGCKAFMIAVGEAFVQNDFVVETSGNLEK